MKLSKKAIKKIDRPMRQKLAIALGFSEYWVGRLVEKNKKNGPLTTPSALSVLREETGFEDEALLETEPAPKPAAK
jgi:hypothetical protein